MVRSTPTYPNIMVRANSESFDTNTPYAADMTMATTPHQKRVLGRIIRTTSTL